MGRNRNDDPRPLSDILQERFKVLGWEKKLREMEIVKRWEEAVGPQVASRTRPLHVTSRRLTVMVESSAWAQQLTFMKKELLTRFEELLGPGVITDIYLISGKVGPPPAEECLSAGGAPAVDDETLEGIKEEASRIPDGELREAFRKTLVAASRRKPEKRD